MPKKNPLREIIPRLTTDEIRALIQNLPQPNSIWKIGNAIFKIYRVKDWFNPIWPNETLYKLLIHARSSYYIYGDRSPLDEYDAKSATYLAQATHFPAEEWLSIRLTPYAKKPINESDLSYFLYKKHNINYWLQKKFFSPKKTYLDYTAAIDRVCAIRPYFINQQNKYANATLKPKQKYAGVSYILIAKQCLEDYLQKKPHLYITSIFNNKMIEKSMIVEWKNEKFPIEFTPAYKFLNLGASAPFSLNRSTHNEIIYKFPSYFLDLPATIRLIKKLVNQKILPEQTINHYLDGNIPEPNESNLEKFKKIGDLFSVKDGIIGSSLTGEELRSFIDKEVPDNKNLELKITAISTIEKNINFILSKINYSKYF